MIPWVWIAVNFLQEGDHEKELLVSLLSHVSLDRDTIVKLIGKRDDRIVDNDDILELTILDDTQIFHIHTIAWVNTVLTVESMLDNLPVWINKVEASVGIILGSGGEHANLIVLGKEVKSHV